MKKQKNSWLAYCLVCIMAIGMMSALVGCDGEVATGAPEYDVTVLSTIRNGTVTTDPVKGKAGATITVTVTPNNNYRLKSGTLSYNNIPIDATLKFTMPAANVTIRATFEQVPTIVDPEATYNVTIDNAITGGTVVANPTSGAQETSITVTATPAAGNQLRAGSFKYTYGSVTVLLTSNPAQFYLPASNVEVTAEFEAKPAEGQYSVIIDPSITNGTVTANPTAAAQGTSITLTVTANEGYQLQAGSLKRGNSLTQMNTTIAASLTFNMPGRDVYITAIFEAVRPNYSQYRDEILAIIADMTIMEKIGQMTQAERGTLDSSNYESQIRDNFLGSVLSGGGSGPNGDGSTPLQWWTYTDRMVKASMDNDPKGPMADKPNPVKGGTGYGIPFVYGIDAVHGHGNAITNPTIFPHNIGMGAIYVGDPAAGIQGAYNAGKVTATEMYATGHRYNFNPVLGVGENSSWGRMYESYSENPDVVAAMGSNYVRGIQWNNTVGACGKHYGFEGQIYTASGVSAGNAQVGDLALPENRHKISPYKAAIDAGLLSVMTFYGQVNSIAPVRYKDLLDILKVDWGFEGFIITDWSNMGTSSANIRDSVNAGVDMNMAATSGEWSAFISTMKSLYDAGSITEQRIDEAVYRILLFKKVFGILDNPIVPQSDPFPNGSEEHRAIARDIAAKTLVLLKNKGDIVGTLKSKNSILITGTAANHEGYQCGGWTKAWQGQTVADIPNFEATTILEGIQDAVGNVKDIQYSETGATDNIVGTPEVIIAVVCETPYSEGSGDRSAPAIGTTDNAAGRGADATMLANVRTNYPDVPIILIVISGRPVSLSITTGTAPNQVTTNYGEVCDGVIAAWLPGSEAGDAIADVLFGNTEFVGKTPMTWYVSPNRGGANPPAVVFPYGWGLRKGEDRSPNS